MLALGMSAVLSVFSASLLLAWLGASRQARADREALERLAFGLEDFYLDMNRYPSSTEGFAALLTPDPEADGQVLRGWRGPYLDLNRTPLLWSASRGDLLDRRARPVLYFCSPTASWVYVAAPGPNSRFDSAGLGSQAFDGTPLGDDLVVWVEGP